MTRKEYQKDYWQKPEVKEKNAARAAADAATPEGKKYNHKKNRYPSTRYRMGKHGARKRKLSYTISFEEYLTIINNLCYYCREDISNEAGCGMDRIDNTKGYSLDNVVPCCSKCNRIRAKSMSSEEFLRQTILNGRRKPDIKETV